ncbi:isoaspartyl peptidase/L-asparaginase family protein [Kytococcus schroeteri]|uniref:isoaspartyl peptidase/L-asparaginase family protein n=1 Tax=Kytococcus schroeteri TaxID=138300 RepID=UPI001143A250|nr:isoaspartyl peptidase/L-asparaginase [Kytococcus schroeteri]
MALPTVQLTHLPAGDGPALALHGGAGVDPASLTDEQARTATAALEAAARAGREVLDAGGPALDAVCAAVRVLEDSESFNAGRGAALTTEGVAELDAAVMSGDSRTGAVTCATGPRNPVMAARAVMERTDHVLMAAPARELLEHWGIDLVGPEYYVTEARLQMLRETGSFTEYRHGTVGAVARDASGHVAAATSTGGITAQLPGRVGDTPLAGCGTWADDATVAVSCTGTGELFVRGAVAHEVHSRLRWAGQALPDAVREALDELVGARGGDGGLVAVTPAGEVVLAFNSPGMYRAHDTGEGPVTGIA